MGAWVVIGCLLAVLLYASGRRALRRYQASRIKEMQHRMNWQRYKQWRGSR